jgi:transposase
MSIELKKSKLNGRWYLSIVRRYYSKETKNAKTKGVRSLGYLDDLIKQYPDPISHFKREAEKMNMEEAEKRSSQNVRVDPQEVLITGQENRKNLGYAALSKIYHELGLDVFFNNTTHKFRTEYSINSIMKLLVFSRILYPASKKSTFENKGMYFEKYDFTLDDIYRSLTFLNGLGDKLQVWIHNKIKEQYNRTAELVYYDVTNYYFEIDGQDELRRKGVSKEHRPNPIVQMGLFMDTMGFPITYQLFPGNTNDCKTLIPMLQEVKRNYDMGRMIVVADKGVNTGENIVFNLIQGDGYVYSQTVRGGHKELKDYVLDEEGYRCISEEYKIKSRVYPRELIVENIYGEKKRVRIDEKQVVFYSRDYDKKAKADREAALLKAHDLVQNPSKYNSVTSYGAAKYIKNLSYDKKTGEIITVGKSPVFDEDKLREEEKFDGYYAIVTSEEQKSDEEIIEIYRGLWKIEETFKVTKSELETRPVYLSRTDHIKVHFLTCFVALVISRILEHRFDNQYGIRRIAETLRKASCSHMEENWYILDYADEITELLQSKMGIELQHKYLRLGDIKKILGDTKK